MAMFDVLAAAVHRRGGATDLLELGDSLDDVGRQRDHHRRSMLGMRGDA